MGKPKPHQGRGSSVESCGVECERETERCRGSARRTYTPPLAGNRSEGVEGSLGHRQVHKRSNVHSDNVIKSTRSSRELLRQQSSKDDDRVSSDSNEYRRSPLRQRRSKRGARRTSKSANEIEQPILKKRRTSRRRRRSSSSDDSTSSRSTERSTAYRRKRSRGPSRRIQRRCDTSVSSVEPRRIARKRRCNDSESDDDYLKYRSKKRCRSRTSQRRSRSRSYTKLQHELDDIPGSSHNILHKFLDVLKNVKGQSTPKLSLTNVVPEFDPMSKDQTIKMWITKIEECAKIYGWNELEIIHFALPKLTGIAKTWYQGLDTVLYSWSEWKKKLNESFPCRDDYAELLTLMLSKRARHGESLEQYYYSKINLLNRCGIKRQKAVDCLLHGVDDRAVRVGAQAAQFTETEDVLKYFKTVKVDMYARNDKLRQDKISTLTTNYNRPKIENTTKIKCFNCDEEGHKSYKCSKPPSKCSFCGEIGHLDAHCRMKQ